MTAVPVPRDGRTENVVVTLVDVSRARDRELALRRLSELDDLTGLPNRRHFVELLDRHLTSERREDAAILANDVHSEPGYEVTPETAEVRSELVVPLLVEGDVWGALNVEEVVPDSSDHDDVILLSTLANQVSAALRAVRLLERLRDAGAQPPLRAVS